MFLRHPWRNALDVRFSVSVENVLSIARRDFSWTSCARVFITHSHSLGTLSHCSPLLVPVSPFLESTRRILMLVSLQKAFHIKDSSVVDQDPAVLSHPVFAVSLLSLP